jgi:hypothetical protein
MLRTVKARSGAVRLTRRTAFELQGDQERGLRDRTNYYNQRMS